MNIIRSMFLNIQMTIFLSLTLFFASVSGSFANERRLTIDNKSTLSLEVLVEEKNKQPYHNSIGFVDPGERITFSYPLKLGRWYLKIIPYAPDTNIRMIEITLNVKQNKNVYGYEIHNSDFSDSSIPNPPNVSILGTWANRNGLATEFRRVGEDYVGTIVACPDMFAKFGYSSGMEWIKVKRTDFHTYKGTRVMFDSDGIATNAKFSCMVENSNELFPHNWFKQK